MLHNYPCDVTLIYTHQRGNNQNHCIFVSFPKHSNAQFSLYLHKGGLNPHSFHFIFPKHSHAKIGVGVGV